MLDAIHIINPCSLLFLLFLATRAAPETEHKSAKTLSISNISIFDIYGECRPFTSAGTRDQPALGDDSAHARVSYRAQRASMCTSLS